MGSLLLLRATSRAHEFRRRERQSRAHAAAEGDPRTRVSFLQIADIWRLMAAFEDRKRRRPMRPMRPRAYRR